MAIQYDSLTDDEGARVPYEKLDNVSCRLLLCDRVFLEATQEDRILSIRPIEFGVADGDVSLEDMGTAGFSGDQTVAEFSCR